MGLDKSLKRQQRDQAKKRREEKRWARKSGPVTVRYSCPVCAGEHPKAQCSQAGRE